MTCVAPAPKVAKPSALLKCRIKKFSSPAPKSLYIQVRTIRSMLSSRPPRYRVERYTIGMEIRRSCLACLGVSRPEGIARHGLLMESSTTEFGRRWFARLKIQRFIHIQRIACGSRRRMVYMLGVVSVVRSGPDMALARAKVVAGKTVVFISLFVMRNAVFKW